MIDLYLLALLLIPLFGGGMLAVFGSRPWAAELNSVMSFCTFAASVMLTLQVVASGPQVVFGEQFFIDQFNVFLVALTLLWLSPLRCFRAPICASSSITANFRPACCTCTTACISCSLSPCCWD